MIEKKIGSWYLSEIKNVIKNNLNVFSCFHCGGGSSMGYKLAGFNVLGGVEIDKEMMAIYKANHNPKYSYLMGVQDFNKLTDIPEELKNLDILDGSPPCSTFSMAGKREKKWGTEYKFREGQKYQRLDDLFFHFIQTAKLLQPKIVIAENVKGLIAGNARGYVKEIFRDFKEAGYETQLFLFNAAKMGVPQARERTFFIARRKDLNLKSFKPSFNEQPISVAKACENIIENNEEKLISEKLQKLWYKVKPGKSFSTVHPKGHCFNMSTVNPKIPSRTVTATKGLVYWNKPRYLNSYEIKRIQTFPEDFNFLNTDPCYVMGMSVPPFMTQRVALEIYNHWFKTENN
jgi:DNA (cytosine-5)-methyltransferase 1